MGAIFQRTACLSTGAQRGPRSVTYCWLRHQGTSAPAALAGPGPELPAPPHLHSGRGKSVSRVLSGTQALCVPGSMPGPGSLQ